MATNPASDAQFRTQVFQANMVNLVNASCMTIVVWEFLITFKLEKARIWPLPWALPKILFLLNRYLVGAILVFNAIASSQRDLPGPFCVFFLRWLTVTITTCTAVVEAILLYRIFAMYRYNRPVLILASTIYGICVLALVICTILDYVIEGVEYVNQQQLPGCYAASVPSFIAAYWIIPTVVESTMFLLTVGKAMNWSNMNTDGAPPTLVLLARDSAIYFTIIFVLLLANLLVFELGPPFLSSLMITPSNTAGCIAGNRMLLNISGLKYHQHSAGGLTGDETSVEMSTMRFGKGKLKASQSEGDGTYGGSTTVGVASRRDDTEDCPRAEDGDMDNHKDTDKSDGSGNDPRGKVTVV